VERRADVQVIVAPDGGRPRPPSRRISMRTRGNHVTVPLGAAASSARVVTKFLPAANRSTTRGRSRASDRLVGDAVMYRGRPAATSPLRPVADLQYRRTRARACGVGVHG
jgi:hypothetical protein